MELPIVSVSQYIITLVSRSSGLILSREAGSLHVSHFSRIHAASPAGESLSAKDSVLGRVACTWSYAPASRSQRLDASTKDCSAADSVCPGSIDGEMGLVVWMATNSEGLRSPSRLTT